MGGGNSQILAELKESQTVEKVTVKTIPVVPKNVWRFTDKDKALGGSMGQIVE